MATGIRSFPLRLRIWLKTLPRLKGTSSPLASLSPYENFVLHGADDLHYSDPVGKVLVLGGFEGSSTLRWASKAREVYSVEPVPDFAARLKDSTSGLSNVTVLEFGVGRNDGNISLTLLGDGTSKFRSGGVTIEAKQRDISALIRELGKLDVLEMNIEGGEYEVLERLLETGDIRQVKTLLVQFHQDGENSDSRHAMITRALAESHYLAWSFPWVWEKWNLK